jgi:hypothetical protein
MFVLPRISSKSQNCIGKLVGRCWIGSIPFFLSCTRGFGSYVSLEHIDPEDLDS